jgi:hypothetical protein
MIPMTEPNEATRGLLDVCKSDGIPRVEIYPSENVDYPFTVVMYPTVEMEKETPMCLPGVYDVAADLTPGEYNLTEDTDVK